MSTKYLGKPEGLNLVGDKILLSNSRIFQVKICRCLHKIETRLFQHISLPLLQSRGCRNPVDGMQMEFGAGTKSIIVVF